MNTNTPVTVTKNRSTVVPSKHMAIILAGMRLMQNILPKEEAAVVDGLCEEINCCRLRAGSVLPPRGYRQLSPDETRYLLAGIDKAIDQEERNQDVLARMPQIAETRGMLDCDGWIMEDIPAMKEKYVQAQFFVIV